MSPFDKIALFIDGANVHATCKALSFDIDYRRLLGEFQSRDTVLARSITRRLLRSLPIRPLINWLRYNGYTVVTELTKEFIDASGRSKVKGNGQAWDR
ncbi:NYN domain-containing protein [Bradyrhizobium sp. CIR3A]|uniref:NYN domain-containing protein n=1 Tax=Bradyrhizobium sp. CIR3A TaxID=2663838 RepID=UPI001606A6CE|nr:uncharacterized LabA/DUF88 family protein [Bradyrhizobium sp. CIR3A]